LFENRTWIYHQSIDRAMEREIDYLIDEGIVSPEDLDIAVKASYGFRSPAWDPWLRKI